MMTFAMLPDTAYLTAQNPTQKKYHGFS
jgi:hypothetical protein